MASATAHNARSQRASLLGVPSEVRLHIYRSLFDNSQIRMHYLRKYEPVFGTSPRCIAPDSFQQSVTQTCRVLRAESLPVLRAAATLRLCTDDHLLQDADPWGRRGPAFDAKGH